MTQLADPRKRKLKKIIKSFVPQKKFIPGETYIPVNGKVFDENELFNGVESILDCWWTEGRFADQFEKKFVRFCGCRYVTITNSGSSANLLAIAALTSTVFGKRALKPGDEVITVACGFPTTVNPILQNQLVAVCLDVDLKTKNVLAEDLEKAVTKKTKAIMMAHTLGNPMPMDAIMKIVKKHNLWLIEDCCDALGSTYKGKKVGTFGDVATYSFYPAHHITMGEGGAVVTNKAIVYRSIRQFRDWGRDCWCNTGEDNVCRKRFGWKMGNLPFGYDHKYIYSQVGYNLKATDMQIAIGLAQLAKLPKFIKIRKRNFTLLRKKLDRYHDYFIFTEAEKKANPSWFGFMITLKEKVPFTKLQLVQFLEKHKVATRHLFAGNLLHHPAYMNRKDIRVVGKLTNSDYIMNNGFWIGVYPGITEEMIEYMAHVFEKFFTSLS